MVYSERLSHLPSWFVQLHDESLGKVDRQGQRVGTTAVPALGPKDQHAQVQLFREGPLDKLLALVIPEAPLGGRGDPGGGGPEAASYLFGKTLFQLLKAEAEATYEALAEAGQRVYALFLPEVSPTPWAGSCSTSCGRPPSWGSSGRSTPLTSPGWSWARFSPASGLRGDGLPLASDRVYPGFGSVESRS